MRDAMIVNGQGSSGGGNVVTRQEARIGDFDGAADGAHDLFGPVDTHEFVDGRVEVAHGDDAVGDVAPAAPAHEDLRARPLRALEQQHGPPAGQAHDIAVRTDLPAFAGAGQHDVITLGIYEHELNLLQ